MSEEMKDGSNFNPAGLAIGVGVGVALGVALDNIAVGIAIGAGTDFYIIPWSGLALLLPALVLLAVVASLLPAVRAARLGVTDALRYE